MLNFTKETIIAGILALCLSTSVFASPFLMSQPYDASAIQPETFTVIIDGVSKTVAPVKDTNNLNVLKFDLAGITIGEKVATITANNIWGNSDIATYNFSATTPSAPTGFYISKD